MKVKYSFDPEEDALYYEGKQAYLTFGISYNDEGMERINFFALSRGPESAAYTLKDGKCTFVLGENPKTPIDMERSIDLPKDAINNTARPMLHFLKSLIEDEESDKDAQSPALPKGWWDRAKDWW